MLVPLIIAGGGGTRLYPVSRESRPKQLMRVVGDRTMVQEAYARVAGLAPAERIHVATTQPLYEPIRAQLPEVPAENYIIEPVGRDTGPSIAYASLTIRRRHPDSTMLVVSADHVIRPVARFHRTVERAAEVAQLTHGLVTIGIRPTRPETGYGYIKPGEAHHAFQEVERFTEKPDRDTAERFVAEGYYWNSGMFVWEATAICQALNTHLPDIYDGVQRIVEGGKPAEEVFPELRRVSIDYGVMERAGNVYVVEADFLWDDVGSWSALERVMESDESRNVVRGDFLAIESDHCIVHSDEGLVAAIGVSDLVIVKAGDVVLVCRKERDQDVKELVQMLKADARRRRYL
ncbi:MAG: mannose-1-phosphate guanylyltransferase [Armatimonadetes bacterium]|nr:mannose-1-phosphate guanylyltransferase [Armatimonadota bacterium]